MGCLKDSEITVGSSHPHFALVAGNHRYSCRTMKTSSFRSSTNCTFSSSSFLSLDTACTDPFRFPLFSILISFSSFSYLFFLQMQFKFISDLHLTPCVNLPYPCVNLPWIQCLRYENPIKQRSGYPCPTKSCDSPKFIDPL